MKPNAAFLLSQVGAHSAEVFASLVVPLKLSPAHAGVLWMLSRSPGMSQREMAAKLKLHPSRVVGLLDELERRGLIERRGHVQDRRLYAVHLTAAGQKLFDEVRQLTEQHQKLICKALTDKECQQLAAYLQRIADERKLTLGVHPGYRWLGRKIKPK